MNLNSHPNPVLSPIHLYIAIQIIQVVIIIDEGILWETGFMGKDLIRATKLYWHHY